MRNPHLNNTTADTSAKRISEEKELDLWITTHRDEALAQHHIEVYYQPVVRTLNGSLCGFEALARWRDPERGILAPAQFIAALEADNQIHKPDVYMIREVCRKLREEIDKGNRVVPVSFNLSRLDFFACDICHIIADYVSLCNLSIDLFHVEITESIITSNESRIRDDLNRLRAKGFSIWMDDFGSGYSSLNVLQDYHFDVIKLA
ncbi:EAL domain-containing protein [Lachnoclostridium sp. Marseille-P6806]|uniref:EAL domain-containing protein n=1 Tax=Lachnoclostridium sp. Marseille-P6806 TaxID=2364793 RepID=UPI0010321995|nr:EAL domain-containing protein [Lachnoclostridium sp. Marseille-P6806]